MMAETPASTTKQALDHALRAQRLHILEAHAGPVPLDCALCRRLREAITTAHAAWLAADPTHRQRVGGTR